MNTERFRTQSIEEHIIQMHEADPDNYDDNFHDPGNETMKDKFLVLGAYTAIMAGCAGFYVGLYEAISYMVR